MKRVDTHRATAARKKHEQPQPEALEQPLLEHAPLFEQPLLENAPLFEQPLLENAPLFEQPLLENAPLFERGFSLSFRFHIFSM